MSRARARSSPDAGLPLVALVGRPNVGKSSLYNRLVGGRPALVEDMPGVTRDRRYGAVDWGRARFRVVDTGGLDPLAVGILAAMRQQTLRALDEADVVVFVVDAREGTTPVDTEVAKLLRKAGRPVLVAANKVDSDKAEAAAADAFALGFPDVFPISASHGRGVGTLLDAVVAALPKRRRTDDEPAEKGETDGDAEGEADAETESAPEGDAGEAPLRLAFVGKPNVGKSSLMNRLLQADRAIVTPIPGTTRDTLEETIELEGMPIVLVDTAGIRHATGEVERIGIERAHRQITDADVVIVMLDSSRPLAAEDHEVLDATRQKHRIVLINKADLPQQLTLTDLGDELLAASVSSSLVDGRGVDSLTAKIVANGLRESAPSGGVTVLRERQRNAVELAASALGRAAQSLSAGEPADIVAVDVMSGLDHLGDVVGATSAEDVLDRIFSEFCIGK